MWVILFMFCFHKASDALNRVRFIVSEAQSDSMSSWWCSNVAVRLMGYPAKAEMVWSTTKDHLQVCRESALIATLTARGKNNTPAQASLQPPSSHACQMISTKSISSVTRLFIRFILCVLLAVVSRYSTAEESPTSVFFSLLWYFKLG